MITCVSPRFFFFFQAEDGIRDGHVTGVQTCALPIWWCLLQGGTADTVLHESIQQLPTWREGVAVANPADRKSTRLNSSHVAISYAVFCLKKKRLIIYKTVTK